MDYLSANVSCMKKIILKQERSERKLAFLVKVIDKSNYSEVRIARAIMIPSSMEK